MDTVKIATSEKHVAIERDGKNVGEIVFNPSDASFAERFYAVIAEFQSKLSEYQARHVALAQSKELDANNLPVNVPEQLQLLRETCEFTRERIDYLFGSGTSQIAFGNALELDQFTQFFDGIAPFIQSTRAEKIKQYLPPVNGNGKKPRKPRKR